MGTPWMVSQQIGGAVGATATYAQKRALMGLIEEDHTEERYDYQVKEGQGWRTVAVELTTEDVDAIRQRSNENAGESYSPVEGTDYRFVISS